MPGPPTPVSACPVRALEVHDGSVSKTYESNPPYQALSITLEACQPMGEPGKKDLVLLIHNSQQRMLSIKLGDLLTPSQSTLKAIEAHKDMQRLCVRIPGQNHIVKVDFEEARDFNVAICVLGRFGFDIGDYTPSYSDQSQPRVARSLSFESSPRMGARLSSIAPLPGFDSSLNHFANPSDLTTPFITGGYSTTPVGGGLQDTASVPIQAPNYGMQLGAVQQISVSQPMAQNPHLNPYNVFTGMPSYENYRPRISSPLRNSLDSENTIQQLGNSSFSHLNGPTLRRSHSALDLNQPTLIDTASFSRPDNPFEPAANVMLPTRPPESTTQTLTTIPEDFISRDNCGISSAKDNKSRASHEFSKLLPQPRQLPFIQSSSKSPQKSPEQHREPFPIESKYSSHSSSAENLRQNPSESQKSNGVRTRRQSPYIKSRQNNRSSALTRNKNRLTQENEDPPTTNTPNEKFLVTLRIPAKISTPKTSTIPNKVGAASPSVSPKHSKAQARPSKPTPVKKATMSKPTKKPDRAVADKPRKETKGVAVKRKRTESAIQKSDKLPTRQSPRQSKRRKQEIESETITPKVDCHNDANGLTPGFSRQGMSVTPWSGAGSVCNLLRRNSESVFVITEAMLAQANDITSKILDQFKADTKNGLDAETIAHFYFDQIESARRDYWYSKLVEMESRPWASCV